MSTEKINFNKSKEYDHGERFEFRFEGLISNQNIEEEKINKLVDKFINEKNFHRNMLKNVSFLRTILKDFEEELLVVEYSDVNNQEIVEYDHGVLVLFKCKKKNKESKNSLHAEFTPGRGLSISFTDYEDSIIDYPTSKNINEQFSELINHIGLLKAAKAVKLNREAKTLIEIYKLFYNENPDFSLPNINVRVQTMMIILVQFGISLEEGYGFNYWGKMPISLNLQKTVNELFPLGRINDIDNPVKLADAPKRIIKIVGETIREVINDSYNKDESLITISKVIHAENYKLSIYSNIHDLCEFTYCTEEEVKSSIVLVKRIENKLNSF